MRMIHTVISILSAWPMVARRSLANWKLLSSVVVGVVLASTIMAGTVIYFDSLRNLALKAELQRRDPLDLDILTRTTKGPTTPQEYTALRDVIEEEYDRRIGVALRPCGQGREVRDVLPDRTWQGGGCRG